MLGDKSKKVEIALRIAHHTFEIIDLKQAQITMIILDALLLKLRTLFGRQFVRLAFLFGAGRSLLVIFQKRLALVRAPPVRPPSDFHL